MLRTSRRLPVFLGVLLLGALSGADGAEPLRLRVTPAASVAPGFVTVQASIEADPQNRLLQVVAASSDFYQSSQVEIDGAEAPRLSVFEFRNLPAGDYQVTAVLIGAQGPRATAFRLARVVPPGGFSTSR
jgi:hypothetical protein